MVWEDGQEASKPRELQEVPSDIQIYCNCMRQIRDRINVVSTIMADVIHVGLPGQPNLPDQTAELIFVQFRKVLENIAFASLSANREKYTEVHASFSKHWRAKDMLTVMDTVNPKFFPVPVPPPIEISPGVKHFGEPLSEGFLTREDFVYLYKVCSEGLHTHNPYREGDLTIYTKYTILEWIGRFQKLLNWHNTQLPSGDRWIIHLPPEGHVYAWPATTLPEIGHQQEVDCEKRECEV